MSETDLNVEYIAGVIDSGSSIRLYDSRSAIQVRITQSNNSVGYHIQTVIEIKRDVPEIPKVLAEYSQAIGIDVEAKHESGVNHEYFNWSLTGRDDVYTFLSHVSPHLRVYGEAAEILMSQIFPRLKAGRHLTKGGFIETVEHIDAFRNSVSQIASKNYDHEYFVEQWGDEL